MIHTQCDTKHLYKVGFKTIIHQSHILTTRVLSAHTPSKGGGGGGGQKETCKKSVKKQQQQNKKTRTDLTHCTNTYTTQIFVNKNSFPTLHSTVQT